MVMQGGAVLLAAICAFGVSRLNPDWGKGAVIAVLCVCWFAFAFQTGFGVSMEGMVRWVAVGPVLLHLSSLLLPAFVWAFARRPANPASFILFACTPPLLVLQPDGGAALALALAVASRLLLKTYRGGLDITAVVVALIVAAVAWSRRDVLPPVAYVEDVVVVAFHALPLVGLLAGLALILVPAPFVATARAAIKSEDKAALLALAGLWVGFVLASVFGNYPAPVIGYGASPLLGWGVSLGLTLRSIGPLSAKRRP